ncbi:MAG TPA: GNAT family N-acetyltransferase [Planctomycetaceae bacterium]
MGTITSQQFRLKTGDNVVIRSALPEDVPSLLVHRREIIEEGEFVVTRPEEFDFSEEQELQRIRQSAEDLGKVLIVAEESGKIVGMLFIESRVRKRLAHRATLHVTVGKAWRSRGVGTVLFEAAIDWAKAHPVIEQLCLAVFATNVRAIGLYRKFGFLDEGRQPQEVKFGPGQYVDNLLMYRLVKDENR